MNNKNITKPIYVTVVRLLQKCTIDDTDDVRYFIVSSLRAVISHLPLSLSEIKSVHNSTLFKTESMEFLYRYRFLNTDFTDNIFLEKYNRIQKKYIARFNVNQEKTTSIIGNPKLLFKKSADFPYSLIISANTIEIKTE